MNRTPNEIDAQTADARSPAEGAPADARCEEFVALYARHQQKVFHYILSLLPNWSDAEDVLQQTSVVLWRKFGEFAPGTDFAAWACTVARYKVLNHLRTRGRDPHVFSEELLEILADEGLGEIDRLSSELRALGDCLNRLGPPERELVRKAYAPESNFREVALASGRTPNSVYKQLHRIRVALLKCIQGRLAAEGWS